MSQSATPISGWVRGYRSYETRNIADFSCVRKFHDCVKRSVASSVALCTTETIQMGSPQQLESTSIVSVVYRATEEATECFTQSRNIRTEEKSAVRGRPVQL